MESSDLTIIINTCEIKCHKKIISQIDYFKNMLAHGMKESQSNTIVMNDMDPNIMRYLIDHIYSQDLKRLQAISYHEICLLHQLSDQLVYFELKNECERILINCLNDKTATDLIGYLESLITGNISLETKLCQYINNSQLFQEEIILSITHKQIVYILTKLEVLPIVKALMGLTWYRENHEQISFLAVIQKQLKSIAGESDEQMNKLVDKLIEVNNAELMAITLKLFVSTPIISPQSDNGIVSLNNFDISKLTFSSLIKHNIGSSSYNTINILYNQNSDWVLKLPTLQFVGFNKQKLPVETDYTCCFQEKDMKSKEWNRLKKILIQIQEKISKELINHNLIIQPILYSIHNQEILNVKVKKNKGVFLNSETRYVIPIEQISVTPVSKMFPYTLSDGRLNISQVYIGYDKAVLQKSISYGLIEISKKNT